MSLNSKDTQINIRIPKALKKKFVAQWKASKEKVSFNTYLANFFKLEVESVDPLLPMVPTNNSFQDDRGIIFNILNRPITAVALIESRQGAERSNHWHKTDWHYLYVLSGEMLYSERPVDGSTPPNEFKVRAGRMVFTAPGMIHRTIFLQDTVLLSLGNYIDHDKDTVKCNFDPNKK